MLKTLRNTITKCVTLTEIETRQRFVRVAVFVLFCGATAEALSQTLSPCEGSTVQRRFALLQLAKIVDDYVKSNGALPELCENTLESVSNQIPAVLKNAHICGSSKSERIYYSCKLKEQSANNGPVVETCTYSMPSQALSCENKFVTTVIEAE